jgi:hypothetical protein
MKKIKLTRGKFAIVDDEDYEELNKYKWIVTDSNRSKTFYAARYVGKNENGIYLLEHRKKVVKMHSILMNTPKGMTVDHINCNGLDNRKKNIRLCSFAENKRNSSLSKNNSSGYKGVSWHNTMRKWRARISFKNNLIVLGYFFNKKEEASTYNEAAKKYHGEFANLNKI